MPYTRLDILVLLLLFAIPNVLLAVEVQENTKDLVIGKQLTINSKILNEERPIWVYLPEDYASPPDKRYPVLYMLDGAFHFHHVTGAVDVLAKRQRIPAMIVVAIPYLDDQRRNRDLTPVSVNGQPPVAAADKFLAFLKNEVISFTEKNYRTEPYRLLFGHSLAGLFSINALIEDPELFNAVFAISPSVYWADRLLFNKIATLDLEKASAEKHLFLSAAGGDRDQIRMAVIDFAESINNKPIQGLNFHYSYWEKENHGTIVHRAFYDDLEALYSAWRLSPEQIATLSLDQVQDHYRRLSKKFGYAIRVPIQFALAMTQNRIETRHNQQAAEIATFILDHHPNEAQAHFAIGYVDFKNGDIELAKKRFETALNLVDSNDPYYPVYQYYLRQAMQ